MNDQNPKRTTWFVQVLKKSTEVLPKKWSTLLKCTQYLKTQSTIKSCLSTTGNNNVKSQVQLKSHWCKLTKELNLKTLGTWWHFMFTSWSTKSLSFVKQLWIMSKRSHSGHLTWISSSISQLNWKSLVRKRKKIQSHKLGRPMR